MSIAALAAARQQAVSGAAQTFSNLMDYRRKKREHQRLQRIIREDPELAIQMGLLKESPSQKLQRSKDLYEYQQSFPQPYKPGAIFTHKEGGHQVKPQTQQMFDKYTVDPEFRRGGASPTVKPPITKAVFDSKTKKMVFRTEQQIADANLAVPGTYAPSPKDRTSRIVPYYNSQGKLQKKIITGDESYNKFVKGMPSRGESFEAPDDKKVFKQKIDQLRSVYPNLSEQEASGLILNTTQIIQNQITNERFVVDLITGKERKLTAGAPVPTKAEVKEPEGLTVWQAADKGTGPGSALREFGSIFTGLVGLPIAKETIGARQTLVTRAASFARAVKNSPRFAEGERKWILKEMSMLPKFLDNPAMLKERAKAVNDYLIGRLAEEDAASVNENLSASTRKQALETANAIRNFVKAMGVPKSIKPCKNPNACTQAEVDVQMKIYDDIESGEEYFRPDGTIRIKK